MIFYSSIYGEDYDDFSFISLVCGTPIIVNPDYVYGALGIRRKVEHVIEFPIGNLSRDYKDEMTERLCGMHSLGKSIECEKEPTRFLVSK